MLKSDYRLSDLLVSYTRIYLDSICEQSSHSITNGSKKRKREEQMGVQERRKHFADLKERSFLKSLKFNRAIVIGKASCVESIHQLKFNGTALFGSHIHSEL